MKTKKLKNFILEGKENAYIPIKHRLKFLEKCSFCGGIKQEKKPSTIKIKNAIQMR